jgi:1,4-dihydroxy-2-naphthoate octaprenyltransferase
MKRAFILTFGLAVLVGVYLVWRGGWPIVVIGLASVLFGVLYTGGPMPLGYLGLGDVLVLAFFGPIATGGTYYVQAQAWSEAALLAGLAPGLLGVGLLTVNNLRDIEGDREAGKRTLAVRFGPGFAQVEVAFCLLGAAVVPVVLWAFVAAPAATLAASAACLLGAHALIDVMRWKPGARLDTALADMGRTLALFALVFCVGWLL